MPFDGQKRRVVVTGMGVITPIGLTLEEYWKSLLAGESGAAPITYFDASNYDTRFACEVKGFDPLKYMDRKLAQRCDPFTQYALAASEMAIHDAGLDFTKEDLLMMSESGYNIRSTLLIRHRHRVPVRSCNWRRAKRETRPHLRFL